MREIDARYHIQQVERRTSQVVKKIELENCLLTTEIKVLWEQLSTWNRLAMNVVEKTDREIKKCMGQLNNAVLFGVDIILVLGSDEDDDEDDDEV